MRSAAFSLAVGLVLADSSVAVLALPAIYRELEVDLGDLHWVLTTFNLVLALVPTPAERVTRRGRRRPQVRRRNRPLRPAHAALDETHGSSDPAVLEIRTELQTLCRRWEAELEALEAS